MKITDSISAFTMNKIKTNITKSIYVLEMRTRDVRILGMVKIIPH